MTLFIIKPDAVRRGLIGEILHRIEVAQFKILNIKMLRPTASDLKAHYAEHVEQPWFNDVLAVMIGQSMLIGKAEWYPNNLQSIEIMRAMIGPYQDPRIPGTIRGDFALNCRENSIHGSDSAEAVDRESKIWF